MPNVKVGDLCYVSGKATTPGLAGRIVEVIRLHTNPDEQFKTFSKEIEFVTYNLDNKAWVCKSANLLPQSTIGIIESNPTVMMNERVINDVYLIPLRDNDEEDEMIAIAGKPLELEGSF